MILKNMEEKQLNFYQPLLSVRRGSSITAPPENNRMGNNSHPSLPPLPYYKSELKSGPVRNPGVVPFKWEHMPGRPKDEDKVRKVTLKWLPSSKVPSSRITNHAQEQADEVLRDSPISLKNSSPDKVLCEVDGSKKEKVENYLLSSEEENVTYVDAEENVTHSWTESFYSCNVSGLNGPESGASLDPQMREPTMGKFLPAAKSVASEIPPFASRRHPVAREQEKQVMKVVKLKKQPPRYSVPDSLPHRMNGEMEDEEYESDVSVKLCGLLPRFCQLNPIPGMRDHVEVMSSVRSVRTRSAYAGACKDKENKGGTENDRGGLKIPSKQYTPVPTNESLMNDHFCHKGMLQEKNASPQLLLDRNKQFLGLHGELGDLSGYLPKNDYTKWEFAAPCNTENLASLLNPPAEKTLYIDSERMIESRHSNSNSSESRGRNPSVDDSLLDMKSLCGAEEEAINHKKCIETTDSVAVSTLEKSYLVASEDVKSLQKVDQDVTFIVVKQPPKSDVKRMKHPEKSSSSRALTPLLPKSPSDSWLSRTLPTMPSRNQSYLAIHAFRASPVDPKRESPLKASNVQNMLFRPAGVLAPILEN